MTPIQNRKEWFFLYFKKIIKRNEIQDVKYNKKIKNRREFLFLYQNDITEW